MNANDSKRECPKCGAAIPAEAPQGLCPKCVMSGAAADPEATTPGLGVADIPSLERVAAAFPNLEVIELIGHGAMGFVYKARQPHIDRLVALKLLPDKLARDPQFAERFNREGRVLAKLSHPNVVAVHDFGRSEHFYWLMMEYVDGVNLRQAMRAGKFSPAEALGMVPKICEALQYAHEQGVLHRDIKPENILLDQKGRVKIADFGIAKLVGEDRPSLTLTGTGAALGTPHYMAPEQLEKPGEVDQRADIYSLGVVLYEMLTGELPIGRFEAPSSRATVSKGVDEAVFRALERDRERRQHSANEFKTEVQAAGADGGPVAASSAPGDARYSRPAIIGASLVGLSLVASVVLVLGMATRSSATSILEVGLVGVPIGLLALAGTILGWVGLSEIRRSRGVKLGLPLAWFAAVTYPFGVPTLGTIVIPSLTMIPADDAPSPVSRFLICVVIAALLSAFVWLAVATARWAANRPRGQHWSTRGWGITTAVLGLLMFLPGALSRPSGNRYEAPSPRAGFQRLDAADRLPAGTVELVALSRHPSEGAWWKPDGSVWTGPAFENPGHTTTPNAEQKAVEMVFRLPGVRDPEPDIQVRIAGSTGWSGGRSPIRNGQTEFTGFYVAALLPKEAVTTTVRIGVADAGWDTLGEDPMGRVSIQESVEKGQWDTLAEEAANSQASLSLMRNGTPVAIRFLGAIESKSGDTVLTVTHDIQDEQVRLVAVDADGIEQRSLLVNESGGHLTATFVKTPLDSIRKFRLQVRPYRWVEFEDVALEPREGDGRSVSMALPGVRVLFNSVNLVEEDGHDRLELNFTRENNDGELSWKSSGRFDGAPVDVIDSTEVNASSGEAVITHSMSLRLPDDLSRTDKLQLLRRVRERWQGNVLQVHVGDEHDLLTVRQPGGNAVVIKLQGIPPRASNRDEVQVRRARERLAAVRERHASGESTAREVAKAECDLAVAEAREDAVLVAEAKCRYTEFALAEAREHYAGNRITLLELLTAEAAHAMTRVLLDEAVQARVSPDPDPDKTAAAESTAAASRLQSALTRLEQVKADIANGTLAADDLGLLEAEAVVGVARAEVQGDRHGAAQIRLDHARKVRERVERLLESGRANATDVEQARAAEVQAHAFMLAFEQLP